MKFAGCQDMGVCSRVLMRHLPMKNPRHPGYSIKDARLDPLGLSVTDAAEALGVARHTLSRVIKSPPLSPAASCLNRAHDFLNNPPNHDFFSGASSGSSQSIY